MSGRQLYAPFANPVATFWYITISSDGGTARVPDRELILGWNLIFVVPFFLALLYLGLYVTTGLTFGEGDADADHDVDADHDLADHDLDHHVDKVADQGTGGRGPGGTVLNFLGIGRVPLSIVLMVMLLTWGASGFMTSYAMRNNAPHVAPAVANLTSVFVAAVISLSMTKLIVALIGRFVPLHETSARRRHELLGLVGVAVFDINESTGVIQVREPDTGDRFQVNCRVEAGAATIPKGSQAKLVRYNAVQNVFFGVPDAQDPSQAQQAPAASGASRA
jgi:hypothetical protein